MAEENTPLSEDTGEFESSPETESAGVDLESASKAYKFALDRLIDEYPDMRQSSRETVEIKEDMSLWDYFVAFARFVLGIFSIFWSVFAWIGFIFRETAKDISEILDPQAATLQARQHSIEARHKQDLLLEVLWARDYVQYILEQPEPVPYHVKRDTLQFLMRNDNVFDRVRVRTIEEYELDFVKLRKAQPTPPDPDAWWWYNDNLRTRRVRQLNAFWFILALVPALAAIILITLLTQRLAVGGLDVLSGASAIAQIILGGGSILAGREIIDTFFSDRSTGRSWQGEITFFLATLFLVVVSVFYFFVPPAAANVYNFFGQRAINGGNAAEAELYLESATRLDPDPHAGNLVEVGCLYLTLGSPDRAEDVFERVLEADSRLLLARYHLSQLYLDGNDNEIALQLISDGLSLLDDTEADLRGGEEPFLPRIDNLNKAAQIDYLLLLSFGEAYYRSGSYQQAKTNLSLAFDAYESLDSQGFIGKAGAQTDLPCIDDEDLDIFLAKTLIDLRYFQAKTFTAVCNNENDYNAALSAWSDVARTSRSEATTQQENFIAEAGTVLSSVSVANSQNSQLPEEEQIPACDILQIVVEEGGA